LIQKTGILGGTFDPVHNGHLALAGAAGNLCNLSEIMLLPAAVPPHKQHQEITDFTHRAAMLEIAVRDNPLLHVSPLEQLLPSPSFTFDTLHYINLHSVGEVEFYFIIGADAFFDILSWHKYQKVLEASHFIVFLRNGYKDKKLHQLLKYLNYSKNGDEWYNDESHKSIFTSTFSLPSVSSSEIRKLIAKGNSVDKLIPKGVAEYIRAHGLYSV
jgi:nicotinate-nucleotide adenylyltransferase